ncbi:MAG TPA: PAS domain-containing protein [Gammaproteobacteria bacterium]|nr:PAS domain-containing protein [Gammaproteobacteria bacterium]
MNLDSDHEKNPLETQIEALRSDLDNLSGNITAAVLFLDTNQRLRRFTTGAARLFKLTQGDVGRPVSDILHELPVNGMGADIAAAIDDGEPREKEIKGNDGCWYRRRISPYRARGQTEGAVVTFTDVTRQQILNATLESRVRERVRTLELLQRVAATVNSARSVEVAFQEVIDAVCEYLGWPIGHGYAMPPADEGRFGDLDVWSRGARERYTDVVAAWRSRPPRSGEGLLGDVDVPDSPSWIDVAGLPGLARRGVAAIDFNPPLALIMPVRANRQIVAAVEFYSPSGAARREPVLALIDQIGSELGYIVERQQLEFRTLRQQRGLAQMTRLAVIGEMAGSIAHQLNQPLTAILNYTAAARRLLQGENPDNDRMLKVCESIGEQAQRAAGYIEHMRGYARRQQPSPRALDIHEPLGNALALVQPAARSASISVEENLDTTLPPVYIDPMQMEQVFIGLLMNAVEAMEKVEGRERVITLTSLRLDDGHIRVTVCDKGEGITDEVMDKIFEPFFSTRRGSIGMGLAVSRSVIEAFGGRLHVERTAPFGVCFHVELPIEDGRLHETTGTCENSFF